MPVCDKYDINMAIHPDDPAWSVFGLPRIIINKKNIHRMMSMVDNPHNGVTFCSGSYGTNLENDLPDMIRSLKGRIHFAHVRNLKFNSPTDFEEAAHLRDQVVKLRASVEGRERGRRAQEPEEERAEGEARTGTASMRPMGEAGGPRR